MFDLFLSPKFRSPQKPKNNTKKLIEKKKTKSSKCYIQQPVYS